MPSIKELIQTFVLQNSNTDVLAFCRKHLSVWTPKDERYVGLRYEAIQLRHDVNSTIFMLMSFRKVACVSECYLTNGHAPCACCAAFFREFPYTAGDDLKLDVPSQPTPQQLFKVVCSMDVCGQSSAYCACAMCTQFRRYAALWPAMYPQAAFARISPPRSPPVRWYVRPALAAAPGPALDLTLQGAATSLMWHRVHSKFKNTCPLCLGRRSGPMWHVDLRLNMCTDCLAKLTTHIWRFSRSVHAAEAPDLFVQDVLAVLPVDEHEHFVDMVDRARPYLANFCLGSRQTAPQVPCTVATPLASSMEIAPAVAAVPALHTACMYLTNPAESVAPLHRVWARYLQPVFSLRDLGTLHDFVWELLHPMLHDKTRRVEIAHLLREPLLVAINRSHPIQSSQLVILVSSASIIIALEQNSAQLEFLAWTLCNVDRFITDIVGTIMADPCVNRVRALDLPETSTEVVIAEPLKPSSYIVVQWRDAERPPAYEPQLDFAVVISNGLGCVYETLLVQANTPAGLVNGEYEPFYAVEVVPLNHDRVHVSEHTIVITRPLVEFTRDDWSSLLTAIGGRLRTMFPDWNVTMLQITSVMERNPFVSIPLYNTFGEWWKAEALPEFITRYVLMQLHAPTIKQKYHRMFYCIYVAVQTGHTVHQKHTCIQTTF